MDDSGQEPDTDPDPGGDETVQITVDVSTSGGSVQPESVDVALGSSVTFTITPDSGYAVDTLTINGSTYINNGTTDAPEGSTWTSVTISDVDSSTTFSVTFAECTDESGVPDKYKHTVTASAGEGGSVSPESQLVVDGSDATIDIIPDEGMAVDTIDVNGTQYVNDGTS